MKLFIKISIILFLIANISFSQTRQDIIYLKNGDIYKGQIIKDVPGEYLQLEMKNGLIKMIKYSDIERRELEKVNNKSNTNLELNDEYSNSFLPVGLNLGIGLISLNFSKNLESPASFKENGWMPGVIASVNTNKNYNLYGSLELSYYIGQTSRDYINSLGYKYFTDLKNDYFKINLQAHYQFKLTEQVYISPFIGYSYTSYYRETIPYNDSLISYKYTFSFNQIPLGLNFDFNLNRDFRIFVSTQANVSLSSNEKYWQLYQTQKYNRTYPDRPEINLKLGNKIGFNISAGFQYMINSNFNLYLNTFFENISYSESDIVSVTEKVNGNSINYKLSDYPGKLQNYGITIGLNYTFNK